MLPDRLRSKYWRLTHLYKIKNKQGDVVTFKPNVMQSKHRLAVAGYNYVYIVKPRQFGFTTDHAIDMLDDCLFIPGMSAAILAHDRETVTKIFAIVKLAYDYFPPQLKAITKTDTKNMYEFISRFDGTRLDSSFYVALKLRGTTVQRLHISEAAYIKDRGEMKRGAKQAVPIGGRIVEESTGNGMNDFYDDVMAAYEKQKAGVSGPMDYRVAFYSWIENPEYALPGVIGEGGYDEDELKIQKIGKEQFNITVTDQQLLWRRWKMQELRSRSDGVTLNTKQQFMQEYPLTMLEAFQSSSGNVFDLERLEQIHERIPLSYLDCYKQLHSDDWDFLSAQEQSDRNNILRQVDQLIKLGVRFWHLPEPSTHYVLGGDPSDGVGGDSSGLDIWTTNPIDGKVRQCAQFFGQMRPDLLAELAKMMAELYNDAFIGIENNMLSTVLFLKDIYDNLYTEVSIETKTQKRSMRWGWNTNTKTRDPMIDEFIQLFEEDGIEINSLVTIKQMRTFVRKENGKREHAEGKSDDALFSAFIALQMRKLTPKRGRTFARKPAGL